MEIEPEILGLERVVDMGTKEVTAGVGLSSPFGAKSLALFQETSSWGSYPSSIMTPGSSPRDDPPPRTRGAGAGFGRFALEVLGAGNMPRSDEVPAPADLLLAGGSRRDFLESRSEVSVSSLEALGRSTVIRTGPSRRRFERGAGRLREPVDEDAGGAARVLGIGVGPEVSSSSLSLP